MRRAKPIRFFKVRVLVSDPKRSPQVFGEEAAGETFFQARAEMAVRERVEPQDIRLDPPRRAQL